MLRKTDKRIMLECTKYVMFGAHIRKTADALIKSALVWYDIIRILRMRKYQENQVCSYNMII